MNEPRMNYSQTLTALGALLGARVRVVVSGDEERPVAGAEGVLSDSEEFPAVWYVGEREFWFAVDKATFAGTTASETDRAIQVHQSTGLMLTIQRAED